MTNTCQYVGKPIEKLKLGRSVDSGGRLTDASKSLFCRDSLLCKAKNPHIMQHLRILQISVPRQTQTHQIACKNIPTTHQKKQSPNVNSTLTVNLISEKISCRIGNYIWTGITVSQRDPTSEILEQVWEKLKCFFGQALGVPTSQ